jgi:hypothetical protein
MVSTELNELEVGLRSEGFLDREVAAQKLMAAGRDGVRVLATVATDQRATTAARVTALRHLPAGEQSIEALRALLNDALPVLRVVALRKVEETGVTIVMPLVEALTRDRASFWDLDEEVIVADVAARVLGSLSSGRLQGG